jgi:glutamyl-tRNA synthetase
MSSPDSRPFRVRFAPSPTGYLHVGGARTALYNWIVAKQRGGTFVLRIEDTDEARNRPEWTTGIIDALAWIGIEPGLNFEGPYYQSALAADHVAAAARLVSAGNAYYCDCTQEVVKARAGGRARPRLLISFAASRCSIMTSSKTLYCCAATAA